MRARSVLVLLSLFVCPALATFRIDMYLSDGNTPLPLRDPNVPNDYRDIMVGTQLCVIVSSDSAIGVSGWVEMSWADCDKKGLLTGRDRDVYDICHGSVLRDAGPNSIVMYGEDMNGIAFNFGGATNFGCPGKWFIWDYDANDVGDCNIVLVQAQEDPNSHLPHLVRTTITLHQVPSRDFDSDSLVNFKDFAILARQWRPLAFPDANAAPSPSDLDGDGCVTVSDLRAFSRFWLNSTVARIAPPDPNEPPTDPQP